MIVEVAITVLISLLPYVELVFYEERASRLVIDVTTRKKQAFCLAKVAIILEF
jgi:hypothetical protein